MKSVILPTQATNSDAYTSNHARAALAWFAKVGPNEWDLSIEEQCVLLGSIKPRSYHKWKKAALEGKPVELSHDMMERLSLLLGIYKGLKIISPAGRENLAGDWFIGPNNNPAFGGKSFKEFTIERGTIDSLYTVRRYLDRARGI